MPWTLSLPQRSRGSQRGKGTCFSTILPSSYAATFRNGLRMSLLSSTMTYIVIAVVLLLALGLAAAGGAFR